MIADDLPAIETFDTLGRASEFLRMLGCHADEAGPTHLHGWFEAGLQHHQPFGIVHGGVYSAVIETFASVGAWLAVRDRGQSAVGVSNSTDFLRPEAAGRMEVDARALHQGRTQQIWEVNITRSDGKPVAFGRVRLQNVNAG